jgi:hypothetical protein
MLFLYRLLYRYSDCVNTGIVTVAIPVVWFYLFSISAKLCSNMRRYVFSMFAVYSKHTVLCLERNTSLVSTTSSCRYTYESPTAYCNSDSSISNTSTGVLWNDTYVCTSISSLDKVNSLSLSVFWNFA